MATKRLKSLGHAEIFRDAQTGKLIFKKANLRRGGFSGDEDGEVSGRRRKRKRKQRREEEDDDDMEGDDDTGDDDAGDDEYGDDEAGDDGDGETGDDFGEDGDQAGDDEAGDEDNTGEDMGEDYGEEEVSGAGRDRRKGRRTKRQTNRKVRRGKMRRTILVGESNTPAAIGDPIVITIRPQHFFAAEDITFGGDGSAKITSIFFGERPIWNNSVGIPVATFSSSSFLRGYLKGQTMKGGLDIVINGTAGTASTKTSAILPGWKPKTQEC